MVRKQVGDSIKLGSLTTDISNMLLCYAKSLQSCPTLCDPIDSSPPGSPIPGILQARTLEWVAISYSNTWKWKVKVKSLSRVGLSATPWTAAYQAPPPMGFSRQEYWSGVPLPSPNMLLFNKISSYPILGEDGKLEPIIISCGLLFILDVVLHNPSSFFSPGTLIPSFLHFLIGSVLCRITILLGNP